MPDAAPDAAPDARAESPPAAAPRAARLIESAPGRFRLEGDLDLAAVAALAADGARLLPVGLRRRGRRAAAPSSGVAAAATAVSATVELDLRGVGQASSAAVALLLEWTDQLAAAGLRLHCTHWPATMARIADLSNLGDLLGTPAPGHPAPDSDPAPAASPAPAAALSASPPQPRPAEWTNS